MVRSSLFLPLIAATALFARPAEAQAAPGSEPRIMAISTFRIPLGAERSAVISYMRKWMVEPARLNPNVLSYRIVQHFYGSNAQDIAIVTEYPNWAAVTADCQPCDAWFQANMPAEGTPERRAFDEQQALFLRYFSSHTDQVYTVDMSLAKP